MKKANSLTKKRSKDGKQSSNGQKKTSEKVKRNEISSWTILERISDAFVALDKNWRYTYMNKKAGEIFDRDPKKMIGKHIWTEFPEGIGQPFYKAYYQAMEQQKYIKLEDYYPPYDKWFENHIYPSPDGLSIYFSDITERKLKEENMRIVYERLAKAQEIGNLGYWELARGSDKIWGSEKALEIFGFPPDTGKVPVKKVESLIPDIEKIRQAAAGLILYGKKYDIEVLINPADGSEPRYISAIGEIENDLHGRPLKIMGILKDITEKKKAEQDLINAYNKTANILESISDGFLTADKTWNIKYWNKEAERCFGIIRENVIDKNLWEIIDKEKNSALYNSFQEAMEARISTRAEEYYSPTNTWIKINSYPTEEGICVLFQDITEIKRQENLYKLEKETLEFYASLKNPSLEELITFLLDGLKKIHPDMLCSVLKVKDEKLYNWSSPHLPQSYNDEVEGLEIGVGRGSCGSAAFLRTKVEVSDILNDPYWELYKDIMKNYEMRSCWSYPIIDSNQNLLGTFGIYHNTIRTLSKSEEHSIERIRNILVNIIEKKLAENEARSYKEKLELIFNTTKDIVYLISVEKENEYRFLTVNQPYLDASGLRKEEVEGKLIEEVFPESSLKIVYEKFSEAISSRKTIRWDETIAYASGKVTVIVTLSPIFNEQGKCVSLLGTLYDITERKKAEEKIQRKNEELEEKTRRLEDIAWVQSHKVRAPLARIMGLVILLTDPRTDKTDLDQLLKYIMEAATELDERIKEIVRKTERL